MRKFFLFAALGLSMISLATEPYYYKTLVDEQSKPTSGSTMLYALEFAQDSSLYLLSSYQTTSAEEVGLHFADQTYQGASVSKWGAQPGEYKYQNMRNSFLAKLDAEGNVIWARPDTTGDYDLAGTALAPTTDGGIMYADKFRGRKGNYMSYINLYNKDGQLVASNNIALTVDSIIVDGKKVARNDAFSWAAIAQDADGYVYLAGYHADTLIPTHLDTIAPRKEWNYDGSKSDACNTVILKYKPQYNVFMDLDYVGAVINSDDLISDRPLGMHIENGKLYLAGTYKNNDGTGIYAACYNTNLEREYIVYHPIKGALQFQQTVFENGKIFVCGGISKGSITIGEKTLSTQGEFNHGLIYVMNMADGSVVDAAVRSAANNALNITVAAYAEETGFVAYNHETLNGITMALHYNDQLNLLSTDTLATGASSIISAVGRRLDGKQTAIGFRTRTLKEFDMMGHVLDFADVTNWFSVLAVVDEEHAPQAVDNIETDDNQPTKFLQNGQLFIHYNGKVYNVLGY
ncbi:MAG: hypothetical protein IJS82_05215 [Paludibacteraceae bacterium]|nr:hypothetical protein [Paludibacteraceae bacterium]